MKFSKDMKTVTLDNGTTILTDEGHKDLEARLQKERLKGNPLFIEGARSLNLQSIASVLTLPTVDRVLVDRESLKTRIQHSTLVK